MHDGITYIHVHCTEHTLLEGMYSLHV